MSSSPAVVSSNTCRKFALTHCIQMHFRPVFILALSCFAVLPLPAQGPVGWARKTVERFTAPKARLDSLAIYQPHARWNATLKTALRQTGVSQVHELELPASLVANGHLTEMWPAVMDLALQEHLYTGVDLSGGYGGLTVGFSREVGRKSADYNRANSLSYQGPGLEARLQYFDIRQPISYSITVGDWEGSGVTEQNGRMRVFVADAVYAFNRTTFAYCAVYKGNMLQRRSAGSLLLGAKYLQGELAMDPSEVLGGWLYDVTRHTTAQGSIGAGYSYNFVLFHHEGTGADDRGLRNLTINLTALPMMTLYDHHAAQRRSASGENLSKPLQQMKSRMRFNYVTQGGVCFAWDRYVLGLTADDDGCRFQGSSEFRPETGTTQIKTTGRFFKWSAVLQFNVKF